MGKQKRERKRPHKENGTGLPSIRDLEAESENLPEESSDQVLQRITEQLQSVNLEDKLSGLQTLETMSSNSSSAVLAVRSGITKIIGPLLIDYSELVRAASASALRSIADNGGEEAHSMLLKDDIVTPIAGLLKKHYANWQPNLKEKKAEKSKADYEKETFIQTVTLLWTLAEKNDEVLKLSEEENLLPLLILYLNTSIYDVEICTVAIQCILTLSEDNPKAINELKKCEEALLKFLDLEPNENTEAAQLLVLKTLVSALLVNTNNIFSNEITALRIIGKALTVLSRTLDIDHCQKLKDLSSTLTKEGKILSRETKKRLNNIKSLVAAQQQALEILANLCTDDQDSDGESELDESDAYEYETDALDDDPMNDKFVRADTNLPIEIIEVITSEGLVKKVWSKTTALEQKCREAFSASLEGSAVISRSHVLRCRAFLCMNNLISSLDIDTLGGADNLYSLWSELGKVIFYETNPDHIELLESATAAMRAALQKLAEARVNMFQQLKIADLQPLLNGERQCPNANVRTNLIRMIGSLAQILVNTETVEKEEIIKNLSEFLLETCTKESEAWVIAESLDAIMDIYAEDETDQLAFEINLVNRLKPLLPIMNTKIRQQKQKLGENVAVVSTVKTNLARFVTYKSKRLSKLVSK